VERRKEEGAQAGPEHEKHGMKEVPEGLGVHPQRTRKKENGTKAIEQHKRKSFDY